jgi:hypothetical protein
VFFTSTVLQLVVREEASFKFKRADILYAKLSRRHCGVIMRTPRGTVLMMSCYGHIVANLGALTSIFSLCAGGGARGGVIQVQAD